MRPSPHHGRLAVAAAFAASLAGGALAGNVDVTYDQPTLDRWNYPFNFSPGTRGSASTFSALPQTVFDNRDGQVLIAWDTDGDVPTGQLRRTYDVITAEVTIMVESDNTFLYDPTSDPFGSYLDPPTVLDPDPGRPVELFGVDYRNDWTLLTYEEGSPFCPGCNCFQFCVDVRNVIPIDFLANGDKRNVTNDIFDGFQATPFAVGQIDQSVMGNPVPGDPVPTRTDMTFTLDVSDPAIQCYLRDGVRQGRIAVMITSLHQTEQMGAGEFPVFFMKENFDVPSTATPARLRLVVDVDDTPPSIGDINDDGVTDADDILAVINSWGACICCDADLDENNRVDTDDLLLVINDWD